MVRLRAEQIAHLRDIANHHPTAVYQELTACSRAGLVEWLQQSEPTQGRGPPTLLAETLAIAAHGVRDPVVIREVGDDLLENIRTSDRPNHGTLRTVMLLSETRPELLGEAVAPLCDLLETLGEYSDSRRRQHALRTLRNVVYGNRRTTLTTAQFQSLLDHCRTIPESRERGLVLGVLRAAIERQTLSDESIDAYLEMLTGADGEALGAVQPTLVAQTLDTVARLYPAALERASIDREQFQEDLLRDEGHTATETAPAQVDSVREGPEQSQVSNGGPSELHGVVEVLLRYVPGISEDTISTDGPSGVIEILQSGNATTDVVATLWRPDFWCALDPSTERDESGMGIAESTDLTRLPGVGEQLAQRLAEHLASTTTGPVTVRDVQKAPPATLDVKNIEFTRYRALKQDQFTQTLVEILLAFYEDNLPPQIDLKALIRTIMTAAAVNHTSVQDALDATVGAALAALPSNTPPQNGTMLLRMTDVLEAIHRISPHLTLTVVAGRWSEGSPWSETWQYIVTPETGDQQQWAIGLLTHLVAISNGQPPSGEQEYSAARASALAAGYRKQDAGNPITSELALLLENESAQEANAILAGLSTDETSESFDLRDSIRNAFDIQ